MPKLMQLNHIHITNQPLHSHFKAFFIPWQGLSTVSTLKKWAHLINSSRFSCHTYRNHLIPRNIHFLMSEGTQIKTFYTFSLTCIYRFLVKCYFISLTKILLD